MIPPKEKARAPKDSMTLLPCFYFVEVGVGWVGVGGGALLPQGLVLPWHGGDGGFAPPWQGRTMLVPVVLGGAVVPTLSPSPSCPSWPPPS